MISDCFGFYLPFLAVGVYLWRKLRPSGGLLSDIAILFLVISTMLGITGAALQASVLGPLAETYMSGNEIAKQALFGPPFRKALKMVYGQWKDRQ